MPLRKLVSSHSHSILAKLIDLGAIPPTSPITVSAKSEENKLQVVIIVAQYEPVTIAPETLARIDAMKAAAKAAPRLTEEEQAIVNVLDDKTPRKAAWIWAKLGKSRDAGKPIGGGFKTRLAVLTRFGVLEHVKGGYRLAA